MNMLIFLSLLIFVSSVQAQGKYAPKEKDFVLPETRNESCAKAQGIIAKKRDLPSASLLKGSLEERYLENLVRVCSGLQIYLHSHEIAAVGNEGIAKISEEGNLFRLQPMLAAKIQFATAVQNFKTAFHMKRSRKHGPLTELWSLGYCQIETARYLEEMSRKYHLKGTKTVLDITSAFRSGIYQDWLQEQNANAIPTGTATGSTHGTLATVDIGYKNLSRKEQSWIEQILIEDERKGRIQATKEWKQMVYHVMVFPEEFFQNSSNQKKNLTAR